MKVSIDISLYPFTENYKEIIIEFIKAVNAIDNLEIEVNGFSTQIFGEYEVIMDALKDHIYKILHNYRAIFVLKISDGNQTKESLSKELQGF